MAITFSEIETIEDIRCYVNEHPNHPITAAWKDMLYDMDEFGENYDMDAFFEEADYQMFDQGGSLDPDEVQA